MGLAYALTLGGALPLAPPARGVVAAQAIVGVALGAQLETSTLTAVGEDWLGLLIVTAGTLAFSLLAGMALTAWKGVDPATAQLGLVAGGASGIVAMSDELGADARLVAFMQYLRVLVIVLIAPVLAQAVLPHGDAAGGAVEAADPRLGADLLFTAGCAVVGVLATRPLRLPAAALLGPMILAAVLSVTIAPDARVPGLVQDVAFAAIGLQVGLRFTTASIRQARRLLPAVLATIVALVAGCAGLAWVLSLLADVPYADAYLATTPGGLYAVLAAAVGTGANTTFVLAVQVIRLFAMVLAAPPLVRLLVARGRG